MLVASVTLALGLILPVVASPIASPVPYVHNVTYFPSNDSVAVLDKRQTYSNERFTWYSPSVGLGACGKQFGDYDMVRSAASKCVTSHAERGECSRLSAGRIGRGNERNGVYLSVVHG